MNQAWGRAFAAFLMAATVACQRQGPTFEDLPTSPATPPPVTPITPIQVAPAPSPTPTDPPEDPPSDGTPPSNPEGPVSDQPVARLLARVYFIECGGQLVPNSGDATEAPVGCRVHLDVTPKDSQGRPTRAIGQPLWTFSNPSIISISTSNDYTPTFTALAPGALAIDCTLDNVQARTIHLTLK